MADFVKSALGQKILTAVVGVAVDWLNAKYNWGLDRTVIIGAMVSIIGGIAIHNAAKDRGINVEGGAK